MIIKSLSRKSNTGQLVNYIFRYILDEEKSKQKKETFKTKESQFLIRHNVRSRSVKGFVKEFQENEKYRLVHRKDSVKLFHTIISFSGKDSHKIDDKLLKDIAKKFITERGLNNLYAGTKHVDKDHVHLHIAISGTQLNGRSSRISKQQFRHLKIEMDRYQREKFSNLIYSFPEHGKSQKQKSREEIIEAVKQSRLTHKKSLCEILDTTYNNSNSLDHFLSLLKDLGQEAYYRNGRLQGLIYEGKKFRFSRLGYDANTLQLLEQKKNKQKVLTELNELRKGKARFRMNEQFPVSRIVKSFNGDQQLLNDLSRLRDGHNMRSLETVEFNRNMESSDLVHAGENEESPEQEAGEREIDD